MVKFEVPKEYVNEPGLLGDAGAYIKNYGENAFVIGSQKSFEVTEDNFFPSLVKAGISYTKGLFQGYPNVAKAEALSEQAREAGADVIIGMGGGRAIDAAKVVGTLLGLPVVTVPTIAATCASWAAVSILYDDQGKHTTPYFNLPGPQLILADTRILMEAPDRYMRAGIIDTFAKWYEISPHLKHQQANTNMHVMTDVAKRAYHTLVEQAPLAFEEKAQGIVGDAAVQTVDAIIYLAGLTGSLQNGKLYQGYGHPFYNASTGIPKTLHLLHGEKVGFGLMLQEVLAGKNDAALMETFNLFGEFDNLLTFADIGIQGDDENIAYLAATLCEDNRRNSTPLDFGLTPEEIESGLIRTDRIVRKYKQNQAING